MARAWLFMGATHVLASLGPTLYALAGAEVPARFTAIATLAAVGSMWYWLWSYARTHRIVLPLDAGLFLAVGLHVALTGYVLWTERLKGLLTLAALVCLHTLAWGTSWLVFYVFASVP